MPIPRCSIGSTGDCWIVDPIDGTTISPAGKPPFGILLALASGGEAHTGWIYDPLTGRFCVAHKGKGAFIDGERVTARAAPAKTRRSRRSR